MSIITPALSKKVGWKISITPRYPNNTDVVASASDELLLYWHRFLPSPTNQKQINLMNLIFHRVNSEESKQQKKCDEIQMPSS